MKRDGIRAATVHDAPVLARLVNDAGDGMPLYLWGKMAGPEESAWDVGRRRAARETGSFSYRNATVIEHAGHAAGALIGYGIGRAPEPIAPDMPPMVVPLQELENLAPDTWYVNVLAVLPDYRDLGLGSRLLDLAHETGRICRKRGMSIIVSDANDGARRLYERRGYGERARRPMVKEGWRTEGREWVLLVRST